MAGRKPGATDERDESREERETRGWKITVKVGLLRQWSKTSHLFGRSAKAGREARITQMGYISFLMQACRLIVYFNNIKKFYYNKVIVL